MIKILNDTKLILRYNEISMNFDVIYDLDFIESYLQVATIGTRFYYLSQFYELLANRYFTLQIYL